MDNCIAAKEPGCEYYEGESDHENRVYGWCVRVGNVKYAMNEVMRCPPVGMEELVYKHFYVKRDIIR